MVESTTPRPGPRGRVAFALRGEHREGLLDDLQSLGYATLEIDPRLAAADTLPDVLIADVGSAADAAAVIAELKRAAGRLPALILLGDGDAGDPWFDRGFDLALRRPLGRAELGRAVGVLLELRRGSPEGATGGVPYQILFESHAAANLLVDPAARVIVDANEAAAALYGVSRNRLRQMRLEDLTVRDEEVIARGVMNVLTSDAYTYRSRHRKADGTTFDVEVFSNRVYGPSGTLVHATVYDISERLAADRERRELEAQLVMAQKMEAIARLAGGVAHDFNNMLTVILGYGEQLHGLLPDGPARRAATAIVDAASRSAALTRQLLAFSRRQPLRPEVLDLNEHVGGLHAMLTRLIGEDIRLDFVPCERPALVEFDPGQIEQVVMNLVVNARDAMPSGGVLTIELCHCEFDAPLPGAPGAEPGRYVQLSVTDTGDGIPAEVLDRIFDPFFTTKEQGKGTGLGLATVYGIVTQSGGHIAVYSEPDHGATFKVRLPVANAAAGSTPPRAPVARHRTVQGERILVVEDDASLRALVATALAEHGFEVTSAASGPEALDLVRSRGLRPELVVSDVVMPEMNGEDLVEALRAELPALRVLFMSGYTERAAGNNGLLSPGAPLLHKPFSLAQLVESVLQSLGD